MGYYYIKVYWDNLNSVTQERIVAVAAASLEQALEKAAHKVSQEWGKFNVRAGGFKLVTRA